MSQQSKTIVVVVTTTLLLIGGAIAGGAVLMRGQGSQLLAYQPPAANPPDPTIFTTVVGKAAPGLDLTKLLTPTPAALAHGADLFKTDCSICHGTAGKGDGAAAAALTPKPRNFTSADGWKVGYTTADIYITLSEGIPGTGMAAFDALTPQDRFALALYVESLGHFDHHDNVSAEAAKLDAKYHLAEGPKGPNKVAVPTVMRHMEAEYKAPPAVRMPAMADRGAGASLRRRLIANPARAAAVLSQVPHWRTDLAAFARVVVADAPDNGFRPQAAALDGGQWRLFHNAVVRSTPAVAGRDTAQAGGGADGASVTDKMIAAGRAIYHGKGGCMACHGMNMQGSAIAPPLDKQGKPWMAATGGTFDKILYVVEHGVPNTAMLAHPNGISHQEASEAAGYVWAVNHRKIKP